MTRNSGLGICFATAKPGQMATSRCCYSGRSIRIPDARNRKCSALQMDSENNCSNFYFYCRRQSATKLDNMWVQYKFMWQNYALAFRYKAWVGVGASRMPKRGITCTSWFTMRVHCRAPFLVLLLPGFYCWNLIKHCMQDMVVYTRGTYFSLWNRVHRVSNDIRRLPYFLPDDDDEVDEERTMTK